MITPILHEDNDISYELNQNDYTAIITDSPDASGDVLIPRTVQYNSDNYVIKKIKEKSFLFNLNIDSFNFAEDSEIEIIEQEAFYGSSLESISIPSNVSQIGRSAFSSCECLQSVNFTDDSKLSVIESEIFTDSSIENLFIPKNVKKFEKGWCKRTNKLFNVTISPENENFTYSDDKKLILCKISEKDENYENLIFAKRDVEKVTIPSYVKIISSYSFSDCEKLQEVNFCEDSNLLVIAEDSFFCSSIKSLFIPEKVILLHGGWCNRTPNLVDIKISPKNENFSYLDDKMIVSKFDEIFDELIFVRRDVKKIEIPSFIKYIKPFSFTECKQLETITFSEDSELLSIEFEAFCFSSIKSIKIPRNVILIGEGSFSYCKNLSKIEFDNDSKLCSIDREAFCCSSLNKVSIPRLVNEIVGGAFKFSDLQIIEFSEDSELKSIGEEAFFDSLVTKLFLPSKVEELKDGWCKGMYYLNEIEISPENKRYSSICNNKIIVGKSDLDLDFFDELILAARDIEFAFIPKYIKHIKSCAFANCIHLLKIEFDDDSQLNLIDEDAFSSSAIKGISIPRLVNSFEENAFQFCFNLKSIEMLSDELSIDMLCFQSINDTVISIPNASMIEIFNHEFDFNIHMFVSACTKLSIKK